MGSMKDLLGDTPYPGPLAKTPAQLARRDDPVTSKQAADRISGKLTELQHRVLTVLRSAGDVGMTDLQLENACGSHGSTFRTRRAELVEAKLVQDSGRKVMQNGSNRTIWIAT